MRFNKDMFDKSLHNQQTFELGIYSFELSQPNEQSEIKQHLNLLVVTWMWRSPFKFIVSPMIVPPTSFDIGADPLVIILWLTWLEPHTTIPLAGTFEPGYTLSISLLWIYYASIYFSPTCFPSAIHKKTCITSMNSDIVIYD